MVELALALPILFLIVFGLIDLGRAVFVYNSLAEGAREGARYGSVQARSFDDASRDTVEAHVRGLLAGVPEPNGGCLVYPAAERSAARSTTS